MPVPRALCGRTPPAWRPWRRPAPAPGAAGAAGSVSDSPAPTRPERSLRLGPAQPSRTREEAVRKRGQRGLWDEAGERGVPSTQAPQGERPGLRPRLGKQAEHRSDPRASEGVLVNWVFAPSGAQGAELTIASGDCADGEQRGSKFFLAKLQEAGFVSFWDFKLEGILETRTSDTQFHG